MANISVGFCGPSPFWDEKLLVNNTFPEFTECFRMTAVTYVPCGWLWLTAPLHVRYVIKRKSEVPAPVSHLNIAKMVTCLVLTALVVVEGAFKVKDVSLVDIPPAFYLDVTQRAATFLLAAFLTVFSRRAKIASPCVLFFFWTFSLVSSVVPVYHTAMGETPARGEAGFYLVCVLVGLLAVQLFLNCWAENYSSEKWSDKGKISPELYVSFLNKLTFHWMNSLIFLSYKRSMLAEDMWELPPENVGRVIVKRFHGVLQKYAALRDNKKKKTHSTIEKEALKKEAANGDHLEMEAFLNGNGHSKNNPRKSSDPESKAATPVPLLRGVFRTFPFEITCACVFKMAADALAFSQPALLSALIRFMKNRDAYMTWHGYALALGFFVSSLTASLCQHQGANHAHNLGIRLRTALIATVYRKALRMNNETRRAFTTGAIVNFMSIDCQRIRDVVFNCVLNVSIPVQIFLAFFFLNRLLGLPFLVGVGVLIGLIPINLRISLLEKRYQAEQLSHKDSRIKMMNELLNGIKVIKLNAWEEAFTDIVRGIRQREIACLRKIAIIRTVKTFLVLCSPVLVTVGTLLTYTFLSGELYLDPTTAFVSLSLFGILRNPVNALPSLVSQVVQCTVSLKRLRKFLSGEELNPESVSECKEEGIAVSIRNGSFTWDEDGKPTLQDISLEVREGQLVAVVGVVGAGKSSLLSAILGEMRRLSGHVLRRGSVAYVSQQAWIQNGSLKDGIIFGNKHDRKRYKSVIHACALQPDLEILPAGDETEIGEKGVNLSGGQKLRVSLARAVYHDADLYLLDDPLSAVDSHVGKHIFREVIGSKGLLRNKTRLMVTHGVHWLPMCHVIVVTDNGRIVQTGTYQDLTSDGLLSKFLNTTLAHDRRLNDAVLEERYDSVVSLCSEATSLTEDGELINTVQNFNSVHSVERRRFPFFWRRKGDKTNDGVEDKAENDAKEGQRLVLDEELETGRIKGHVIKAVMKAFGWLPFTVAMVTLLVHNAFELSASFWLVTWTEDSYLKNTSLLNTTTYLQQTVLYVSVYAVLGVLQALTTFLFVGIVFLKMLSASKRLHDAMLTSVLHQPMSFFDTNPMGRILNRFSRDTDALDMYLAELMRIYFQNVFNVINVLFVISFSTPAFLAAAAPLIILYYVIQTLYIPFSRQVKRHDSNSRSPLYAHFSETLSGAPCIRAFGATDTFIAMNEQLVDTNSVYYYALVCSLRWLKLRLELLGNLTTAFAALFTILSENLSPSMAGLSVSYAVQITSNLNNLVQNAINVETNLVSAERMVQYSALPLEPAWVVEEHRPADGWPDRGDIRFHDYSTRYRPGLGLVLNKVVAHIQGGEKVGVVGRTGAGKSSLSLSLFRLIEAAEGSIIIDDINIADIGLHDLRSRLTILPQDPVLFSGTLRFNLDPLSKFSDEQLWSALEQSHLKAFVETLSRGLEHEMDEGGLNLSVGQRQLVCLARALLRKTRVLVLDEATAAVDMETDELIQRTIRSAFRECTVLTIAHRLHTVLDYDRILVLSNGAVLEFDSPAVLLRDRNSVFFKMAQEANLIQNNDDVEQPLV